MIRSYPIRVLTDLSACRYDGGASHAIRAMHVLMAEGDPEAGGGSTPRRTRPEKCDGQIDGHVAMGVVLFP